jgi:hypothetical protein
VRKFGLLGLALALLFVGPTPAGTERGVHYERPKIGLLVTYPASWRSVGHALTRCINPVERIDLVGPGGALFMLQESLGRNATAGMPARPRTFEVSGAPSPLECCRATGQPGWLLPFQEGGRGFYAYLYPGRLDERAELVAILNSIRVRPTGAPIG